MKEDNTPILAQPEGTFEKGKTEPEEKEKAPEAQENKPEKKEEENKDKKEYSLEDVVEYTELKNQYEELQGKYMNLEQDKANLESEIASLKEFKLQAERKDKQGMIDSFYMLSDEDKQDVVANIDTYSLEDIEAKLSVICVRNKVDFNLNKPQEQEQTTDQPTGMFSLDSAEEHDNVPDWIKAVRQNRK